MTSCVEEIKITIHGINYDQFIQLQRLMTILMRIFRASPAPFWGSSTDVDGSTDEQETDEEPFRRELA